MLKFEYYFKQLIHWELFLKLLILYLEFLLFEKSTIKYFLLAPSFLILIFMAFHFHHGHLFLLKLAIIMFIVKVQAEFF